MALLLTLALMLQAGSTSGTVSSGLIDTTFARCGSAKRVNCVVDGDTLWHAGTKVRLADINTPEISRPGCEYEKQLGEIATQRLIVLLNEAPFRLVRDPAYAKQDEDRYGRKLRVATRGGQSLGAVLVAEGLAERWTGRRRNWC